MKLPDIKSIKKVKDRINRKTCTTVSILLIVCIIVGAVTMWHERASKKVGYIAYDLTDKKEIEKNKEKAKKANHVSETVYDGANVPYILYDEEFISEDDKNIFGEGIDASDSYCSNKDLVKSLGDEQVQEFADTASGFMEYVFANNYRDIETDTDAFIEKFLSMYANTSSIGMTTMIDDEDANEEGYFDADVMASKIAEMYVDNSLTLDTKFYTDKSLVYYKYYTYFVRGMLEITPTSTEHKNGEECKPFKDIFGIDVNYGETVQVVVEVDVEGNKDMGISNVFFYKVAE